MAAWAKEITVHDSFGRPVNVNLPVRRVVFLEAYEFIPAYGIWDRVVGISRHAYTNDLLSLGWSDFRKKIPFAGTAMNVNIESLLQQKPDLVITWAPRKDKVEYMEKFRLQVLSVYPARLREIDDLVLLLAQVFEKEERGKMVRGVIGEIIGMIESRKPRREKSNGRKVLWLGMRPTHCAGQGSLAHDLLSLSGANNVAAEIKERYGEVPLEKIIAWNPEVIFIWGHARYGVESILNNEKWRPIQAVRERRVYQLPPWSMSSPRIYLMALWMAMNIYPERYGDLDFKAIKKNFYERTFGLTGGKDE